LRNAIQLDEKLGDVLRIATPIAVKAGLRREMVELMMALPIDNEKTDPKAIAALGGGFAAAGDLVTAREKIDLVLERFARPMVLPVRIELVTAYTTACALLPRDEALDRIVAMTSGIENMSDSYGTNTHYCWSFLRFTDALIVAVASTASNAPHG